MANLQSTNRVAIAKCRETTFGVTPATPAFKALRETSSSLAANPQTIVSNEIRSDRQVTDLILVGYQAGGDIAGELSFAASDDDLEEALQGTWSSNPLITVVTLDTEISDVATAVLTVASALGSAFKAGMLALLQGFTTAANNIVARVVSSTTTSITLTSTLLDLTTLGLHVGQWFKIGGTAAASFFATAANNDWVRISAIAAAKLSLDRVPAGWTADTGTAVLLQCFVGDFLINASTERSNTIERQYLDHSPVTYEYLRGQALDKMAFSAQAQQIATYTKTYVGSDIDTETSRFAGATDVAAPTRAPLNTSSNVGRIGFDGSVVATPNFVKSATWDFTNNLRRQTAVGSLGAVGIGNGEFAVTGQLDTYFGSKAILDKIVNNTLTSFDIRLGRSDGNKETLVFDFPSIKLASGSPAVSGKNADVMLQCGFTAFMDATLLYTVSVQRVWYLPT